MPHQVALLRGRLTLLLICGLAAVAPCGAAIAKSGGPGKIVVAQAESSSDDRASALLLEGFRVYAYGSSEDALKIFKQAVIEGAGARAFIGQALVYRRDYHFELAAEAYERALYWDPNSFEAKQGAAEMRASAASKAPQLTRQQSDDYFKLCKNNDEYACTRLIDVSAKTSPINRIRLYDYRSEARTKNNNFVGAITDISNLLDLDPENGDFYVLRARLYQKIGNYAKSLDDYNVALKSRNLGSYFQDRSWNILKERTDALAKLEESRRQAALSKGPEKQANEAPPPVEPAPPAQQTARVEERRPAAPVETPTPEAKPAPVATLVVPPPPAEAPEPAAPPAPRFALVIGNGDYENVTALKNPAADAEAVAAKLKSKGFAVTLTLNARRSQFLQTLDLFLHEIPQTADVLVYYAGHGVELDGANYLLPVDVPAVSADAEALIKESSINLNSLLAEVARREAESTVVILDACRNNPFRSLRLAGLSRGLPAPNGLGPAAAPQGVFIMYSAGLNETALDRISLTDPNPNSLFARDLLPLMDENGLEIRELATRLRIAVSREARAVHDTDEKGHRQVPAVYDQMLGRFYFSQTH